MHTKIFFLSLALLFVPACMVAMDDSAPPSAEPAETDTELLKFERRIEDLSKRHETLDSEVALLKNQFNQELNGLPKAAKNFVVKAQSDQRIVRASLVTGALYGLGTRFAPQALARVTPASEAGQCAAAAVALGTGALVTSAVVDGKNPTLSRLFLYTGGTIVTAAVVKAALSTPVATKALGRFFGE